MTEIIPAVIASSFEELNEKLARFINISNIVQLDICDGKFTPSISWPMQSKDQMSIQAILEEEDGLPFWDKIDYEFDLMVINAHKKFDFFARLGAKRIVFHLEAETESDFKDFLESLDPYLKDNIEIGLAINTTTDVNKLDSFINHVDFIQCMGIENIGYQGEPFDERVLEQIKSIHTKYPEMSISVDGSVNEETAPLLIKEGVTRLVVGSALVRSYDIREKIKEFESL